MSVWREPVWLTFLLTSLFADFTDTSALLLAHGLYMYAVLTLWMIPPLPQKSSIYLDVKTEAPSEVSVDAIPKVDIYSLRTLITSVLLSWLSLKIDSQLEQ